MKNKYIQISIMYSNLWSPPQNPNPETWKLVSPCHPLHIDVEQLAEGLLANHMVLQLVDLMASALLHDITPRVGWGNRRPTKEIRGKLWQLATMVLEQKHNFNNPFQSFEACFKMEIREVFFSSLSIASNESRRPRMTTSSQSIATQFLPQHCDLSVAVPKARWATGTSNKI